MNTRKVMFTIAITFFCLITLVLTGCDDTEQTGDAAVPVTPPVIIMPPPVETSSEFEYLYINPFNNIFLGNNSAAVPAPSLSRSLSSVDTTRNSGAMTVDVSGDLRPVMARGGNKKNIKKILKISRKGGDISKIKGAFEIFDEDTNSAEWILIDRSDRSHKLKKHPRKNHRLANASMFYERGNIFYLDSDDDLIEFDVSQDSTMDDNYKVVRSGVRQAVMDSQGNWMLELLNGRVVHRDISGDLEIRMTDNVINDPQNSDAETNKFFFAQGDGFIYFGEAWTSSMGVFFRTFLDDQGVLQVVSAQANNVIDCYDNNPATLCEYLNFYPHYNPDLCSYQAVGNEELLLCGQYVYQLGDASHDMEETDFIWAGHLTGYEIKVVTSNDFVYYYSDSPIYNGSRLTRIDLDNQTCRHLFSVDNTPTCGGSDAIVSNNEYIIDQMTASPDNTIRFCGRRVSGFGDDRLEETQLLLVEIPDASADAPVFRETEISECNQLLNL